MTPLFSSLREASLRCIGGFIKSEEDKWFKARDTYGEYITDGTIDNKIHYTRITADMFKPFYFIYSNRLCRMSRLTRRRPFLQALAAENCSIFYTNERGDKWVGHLILPNLTQGRPVVVGKNGVSFIDGDFIIFRGNIFHRLTLIGKESGGEINLDCDSITASLFMRKYNAKR